jgi:hypothetical protein
MLKFYFNNYKYNLHLLSKSENLNEVFILLLCNSLLSLLYSLNIGIFLLC